MNYDKLDRETILYITKLEEEVKQLIAVHETNAIEISKLLEEKLYLQQELRKCKNLLWWSQEDDV